MTVNSILTLLTAIGNTTDSSPNLHSIAKLYLNPVLQVIFEITVIIHL
jgi:hypothetical protein